MKNEEQKDGDDGSKGERIAKRMARAGVCSRRDDEKLIAEGRVKLNGKVLETPATIVTEFDKIEVDGIRVGKKEPTRLWRYHKPSGLVTSHKDESGRPTVFENLPEDLPRVVSVGRLDLTSEGLLLLKYRVRAWGDITEAKLQSLRNGIRVDGVQYGEIEASLDREQGDNVWLNMVLTEGKNREIRKVLEYLGLKVNRLIRTSYGPFHLGKLVEGEAEEVRRNAIKEALGGKFLEQ